MRRNGFCWNNASEHKNAPTTEEFNEKHTRLDRVASNFVHLKGACMELLAISFVRFATDGWVLVTWSCFLFILMRRFCDPVLYAFCAVCVQVSVMAEKRKAPSGATPSVDDVDQQTTKRPAVPVLARSNSGGSDPIKPGEVICVCLPD